MFGGMKERHGATSPFLKDMVPDRRSSDVHRAMRRQFANPPTIFKNCKLADEMIHQIYWTLRSIQFNMCFKVEQTDVNSLSELKFEPAERPPSIESLREATHERFSDKWLKYMYAKFKNECPAGRMKLHEFKRLMGAYVPDRISDAYLERMFYALCTSSPYADQLTFKDLMVSLATFCDEDTRKNAEWTMRLINANNRSASTIAGQVTLEEFSDFVKSIFLLVGRNISRRKQAEFRSRSPSPTFPQHASQSQENTPPPMRTVYVVEKSTLIDIRNRAFAVFRELDVNNQGYLTVDSLERLFRSKESQR